MVLQALFLQIGYFMSKVLIIRFSAFGDVAMLVPVLASVAKSYPQDEFVVLTRKIFAPLFESLSENVSTLIFDPMNNHQGFKGLMKLNKGISLMDFTHIADVHDVLRSKIIRFSLLTHPGVRVEHIDKGREEKKNLIRTKKLEVPLKSSVERYADVFTRLGFPFILSFQGFFDGRKLPYSLLGDFVPREEKMRIGVAPFARHQGKVYPIERMEEVIQLLNNTGSVRIFLFGGKGDEEQILKTWSQKYEHVETTVGRFELKEELLLMQSLDVLVSMDSANMHLASLVNTPVVSIWGATHPSLGFYGYGQLPENAVQIDLECRPCSVYGKKPCSRTGDEYACLKGIPPEQIVRKVMEIEKTKHVL